MSSLSDLAAKYGTDKLDHGYIPHYERHLPFGPITLLEVGVWEGASLRMWRDYYSSHESQIVGVDKHDRDIKIDGVKIIIQDQDDEIGWHCLGQLAGGFDVIIDDASHISSKTIATFTQTWPWLAPGGLYVIEDLQTSYDVENYGKREACSDPRGKTSGGRLTAMQFCKRLADEVNRHEFGSSHRMGFDVGAISFYPNICFITKEK